MKGTVPYMKGTVPPSPKVRRGSDPFLSRRAAERGQTPLGAADGFAVVDRVVAVRVGEVAAAAAVDRVAAAAERVDDVVAVAGEDAVAVAAGPDAVVAGAAAQHVGAVVALEVVVAGPAVDEVRP